MTLRNQAPISNYQRARDIHWVIDARQTIVINQKSGAVFCLTGIEAAIWSWLTLSYPYQTMLELISGMEQTEAAPLLHKTVQKWRALGLLEKKER